MLLYDPERCTGCRYCEIACAYSHLGVLDVSKANLTLISDVGGRRFEMAHCLHCNNPVCVSACPTDALHKNDATGRVDLNRSLCIGCKSCIKICPIGAPWFNGEEGVVRKCDLCDGDPLCAKYCSPGAMKVTTRADATKAMKQRYPGGDGSG